MEGWPRVRDKAGTIGKQLQPDKVGKTFHLHDPVDVLQEAPVSLSHSHSAGLVLANLGTPLTVAGGTCISHLLFRRQ